MAGDGHVIGWKLDGRDRERLLERFPPAWPEVIADHVTLRAKVSGAAALPAETEAEVVGHVDDGAGLEALVVRIGGTTDRPDGSTYHITWSLDRARGRRPVQSNDVLRERSWRRLDAPVAIRIIPARF